MRSEVGFPDVIDFQEGPGIMARDFRDSGIPLIRLAGLSGDSLLAGCNYLDPEMVERRWPHFRLRAGDTLISTSASLGRVARVDASTAGAIAYTGIIRMRPRDGRLLSEFIQYLVAGEHFQRQVEAMGAGSVLRHFGPTHLRSMTVVIPPVGEQKTVAKVLGALDDKIDSNRRLAGLMEETAAALFRAWFEDFVGIEEFEDSEIGRIPRGWPVRRIDELASINAASHSARDHPDHIQYVDISSVGPHQIREVKTVAFSDAPSRARRILRSGDTIVSTVRPERRAMAFIHEAGVGLTGSTGFAVVTPHSAAPTFVYRSVTSDACIDHLAASASGSAYPAVNSSVLASWRVPLPPDGGEEYEAFARPAEARRHALAAENDTLTEVRDALLPKLISGQIRVPDTADQAELVESAAETLAAAS